MQAWTCYVKVFINEIAKKWSIWGLLTCYCDKNTKSRALPVEGNKYLKNRKKIKNLKFYEEIFSSQNFIYWRIFTGWNSGFFRNAPVPPSKMSYVHQRGEKLFVRVSLTPDWGRLCSKILIFCFNRSQFLVPNGIFKTILIFWLDGRISQIGGHTGQ